MLCVLWLWLRALESSPADFKAVFCVHSGVRAVPPQLRFDVALLAKDWATHTLPGHFNGVSTHWLAWAGLKRG